MMSRSCLAALAIGLFALPAAAQEQQSPCEQCLAKAEADPAMMACATQEIGRQEARLKSLVDQTAAKAGDGKAAFDAAQAAWLQYRDAQCAWEKTSPREGESMAFTEADCKIALIEARAGELDARLNPEPDGPPPKE